MLSNTNGYSCHADAGEIVGVSHSVSVIEPGEEGTDGSDWLVCQPASTLSVMSQSERLSLLRETVGKPDLLDTEQSRKLHMLLEDYHSAFSLEEGERGETDLVEMEICMGDASPRRVAARRMPLAVRQEVSRQLQKMQDEGIIQPSNSPWASPIVMVRKRDGSHHFCVDYRELNSVTKLDTYPLPRVDDLLDQLGESRFFSTLDLASGYWQIRVAIKREDCFCGPHWVL